MCLYLDKGKGKVSCEDLGESQFNDFSTYHLQRSDSDLDFDITDSDSDSLYDVDENIEEFSDFDEKLLQVRKSNIEKQTKENGEKVNLDEIPAGPVGIDIGFEDIYKNKGVRYEGKLGGDDPYFDSSDPGSDISDGEEGDLVDDDEVVDLLPRTLSSKIYFDKTAKKVCFQLYVIFFNVVEFREALQSYSIKKGVNLKLKPNEKERCIIHDLELEENGGEGLTVMSDMQKEIPCAHAIAAIHYNGWNVESFVDHWYQRKTYLKAYDKYIQPMTNINMWPRSTRPPIDPPEITLILGKPGKNRKKAKDEPVKKKFGKVTRKERKMTCSVCKCIGHKKKGCPTLKKNFSSSCDSQLSVQASTSTVAVAAAERDANASTAEEMPANAKSSNRRTA
ncbi:hypothetical protein FXO37_23512 [Capsicum annuum]|nr:hypothetical protein FXO37_23512 [Capsicum annuum]